MLICMYPSAICHCPSPRSSQCPPHSRFAHAAPLDIPFFHHTNNLSWSGLLYPHEWHEAQERQEHYVPKLVTLTRKLPRLRLLGLLLVSPRSCLPTYTHLVDMSPSRRMVAECAKVVLRFGGRRLWVLRWSRPALFPGHMPPPSTPDHNDLRFYDDEAGLHCVPLTTSVRAEHPTSCNRRSFQAGTIETQDSSVCHSRLG